MIQTIELGRAQTANEAVADYQVGTVSLAYVRDSNNVRHVLLARVDLWTEWHEVPVDAELALSVKKPRLELNFRRWRLSPAEAVSWYESFGDGIAEVPPSAHATANRDALQLAVPKTESHPAWPHFTSTSGTGVSAWLEGPAGSRIHHRIPCQPVELPAVPAKAATAVGEWFGTHFGMNILDRLQLLGSAHLSAHNPFFFSFGERLVTTEGTDVALRFHRFPGRSLEGLRLHVRSREPDGTESLSVVQLSDEPICLRFPQSPNAVGLSVVCPNRGLLFCQEPAGFLRGFEFQASVVSQRRSLTVHRRNGRVDQFDADQAFPFSERRQKVVPTETRARIKLALDATDFKQKEEQEHLVDQERWFSDDAQGAANFVRDQIRKADHGVLVVDPYFDAESVVRFGIVGLGARGDVRILTSLAGIKEIAKRNFASEATPIVSELEQFSKHLENVTNQGFTDAKRRIVVRLMAGKRPPIHDRFLICDSNAWLVGSSFNELGERGTMIVRIRRPDVLADLESAWDGAKSLETVLEHARNATP